MPRRKVPTTHSKARRAAWLKKRIVIWKSQIRTDHEKIAELQIHILNAERMLIETQRELDEVG